jgi:hypothetical protein
MRTETAPGRVEKEASRKAASKGRGAESAARAYLRKNLGWLRGFPAGRPDGSGAPWMTAPRLGSPDRREKLVVSRELLRRSEFCRNAAPRKFPRALGRVVGDVDEWSAQIEKRLKWLKEAVHSGKNLPEPAQLLEDAGTRRVIAGRVAGLVGRGEGLSGAMAGLVWVHWGDEAAFAAALSKIEQHAGAIESIAGRLGGAEGVALALQCVELLVGGGAEGLVGLLADRRSWEIPLSHGELHTRLKKSLRVLTERDVVESLNALGGGFERPKARLGPDLAEFAFNLTGHDKTARRRRLQFLQALAPEKTLNEWESWWAGYDLCERRTRKLLNAERQWFSWRTVRRERKEVKAGLASSLPPPPPPWRHAVYFRGEPVFAAATSKAFASLLGCIGLLSGSWKGRSMTEIFLQSWAGPFHSQERGWGVIERLLAAQRGLLERAGSSDPEKQAWICDQVANEFIEIWISEGKPQRLIGPVAEALGLLMSSGGKPGEFSKPFPDYTGWGALLAAVDFTGAPSAAAALLAKVPPSAGGLYGEAWELLLRLSGGSAERFEALAGSWRSWRWTDAAIKELAVLVKEPGVARLVTESLLDGPGASLIRVASQSALLRALASGAGEEAEAKDPGLSGGQLRAELDLAAYPVELHDLLLDLARLDPNASRTADGILSRDYPLPARLKAELSFLRKALEQSEGARRRSLTARIAGLEERLAGPPRAPGQRLGRYRAKLERRMRALRLAEWEARAARRLQEALEAKLGGPPPEDWRQDGEILDVLTALAGLPAGFRKLAFRLLRARRGPEPWDLREEEPNRAFLAQIERRGIDVRPWLDGVGPREIEGAPEPLWLDLEKDPLQIMRMGEPFDTCLSPGSFNFFSAVSNAADINKRVLNARDREGVIRGRCLLALTDDGCLLTFRVYAHAHGEVITKAVTKYVLALAGAMGANVGAWEEVRTLVANRWYDDGSVDLTGRLAFLHHKSEFVEGLGALPANELVPELERLTGQGGITPGVVRELVETAPFRERPELGVALAGRLGPSFPLNAYSRLTLTSLLRKAGKPQAALAMIEPLVSAAPEPDSYLQSCAALELIELGEPHRALRLIRWGRRATARDWSEDSNWRIVAAAKALEALARPRQALELYRIAGANGDNGAAASADELERRLRRPAEG